MNQLNAAAAILRPYMKVECILPAVGTGLGLTFAYVTYKQLMLYLKYRHIPGPPLTLTSFYLGNLIEVLDTSDGKSFPEKMLDW
jgi:hypothetical protein